MRTSVVDEGLQIKQPCQNSAMWGQRLPRQISTWHRDVQLWWNSRNDEGVADRKFGTTHRFLAFLLVFTFLFFASSLGFAKGKPVVDLRQKVSPELLAYLSSPNPGSVDVVIQLTEKSVSFKFGMKTQRGRFMKNVEMVSMTIAATDIPVVAAMNSVRYISWDRPVRMSLDHAAKAVAADVGWSYGLKGKGLAVAVIDSGIWEHPDLNEFGSPVSRVVYSESFVPGDASTSDLYGHGTHVAGIVAGNGQSSANGYKGEYRGIAPEVNIVNLRVLDANGQGADSAVIAAIDRAIEFKSKYNIGVINLSLGRPVYESYVNDPLCQAVEAAWKAGIVVVVAAGNGGRDNTLGTRGYATVAVPANDPYVITVGATDMNDTFSRTDDTIASYSAKGPTMLDHVVKPDLVAPGNRVVSLVDPDGTLTANNPKLDVYPCDPDTGKCNSTVGAAQYFRLSGTSMAAPVVAGAAALMLQSDPTLTPDLIKARMMKTAWKGFATFSAARDASGKSYKQQADIFTYGAGYLDVQAALNSTDTGDGAALSPTASYDALTGVVSLSFGPDGTSVIWGSSVLWGSSVIWGATIADANTNALWGNSVVWGATLDAGFSVIWGSSVIWGARTNTAFSPGDEGDCAADDATCGVTDPAGAELP
ncbi:MAG: S8 family peptidase [Acidobacteriales bacterium]|nr:S8 family peptidase [Terriglobales bacterium]